MKRFFSEYYPYILALLPVLLLRDFSPANELQYLSAANEMIREGHLFCLTYDGEPYTGCLPFYIWLIALLKVTLGHHYMLAIAFLFSTLPAFGILWVMNRWVEKYDTRSMRLADGSNSRILANFMLFTSGLQLGMSFFVRPDMLFSFWIVCALYTFWRLVSKQGAYGPAIDHKHHVSLNWNLGLFVFLAIFTKGPQGFTIPFLVTSLFLLVSGKWRLWYRVWNWRTWLVILSLCGIWVYLTWLEGGDRFVRILGVQYPLLTMLMPSTHEWPWYYYCLSLWRDTLPWGPVCLLGLFWSLWCRFRRHELHWPHVFDTPLQNFFGFSFVLMLIYFSALRYRLEVNLLPLYPYLVYCGVMQLRQWQWPIHWYWPFIKLGRVLLLLVFILGCFMPWIDVNTECYGRVCRHAKRLEQIHETHNIYVYHLRRTSGMDTYLEDRPIDCEAEDIAAGKLRGSLLIMKEYRLDRLRRRLTDLGVPSEQQGRVVDELGAYVILLFE